MPERVRVKGVLQASDFRELYSESGGALVQTLVRPGSWVKAGQPLARLDNPELGYEIRAARRQREQLQGQADFYRKLWASGDAGAEVILDVLKGAEIKKLGVKSIDRHQYLRPKAIY